MTIKIACIFLAFRNLDVIKISLESIIEECNDSDYDVDIYVVENHSEFSEVEISPYLVSLVKSKKLRGYAKLNQNVTNNSFHLAIDCKLVNTHDYTHVIFTDGDVFVPKGAIQEQLNILKTCPETIACGLSVAYENWQLSNKLDQAQELIKKREHALALDKPYLAIPGGFWFAMFSASDYRAIYSIIDSNGLRVHDGIIQKLVRFLYRREWVQTRSSVGRELHREHINKDYDNRSIKKNFQRNLIESGYAEKGYELPLYYHRKPATGIFIQQKSRMPIDHSIKYLNPTESKSYDFDLVAKRIIENSSKTLPLNKLYVSRRIPPISRTKNLTCLIRFGIGTSFYIHESNSLFLQMRDLVLNPLKGPIGFPPFHKSSISKIYLDGFFLQSEITESTFQAFLASCFEALVEGGYLRLAVIDGSALTAATGSSLLEALCNYALISYDSQMETDIQLLKNILKQRNAFVNEESINQLLQDSKTEPRVKSKKICDAGSELNPIDPSLPKSLSDLGFYLYVYKKS